jgi:hypothetical protein
VGNPVTSRPAERLRALVAEFPDVFRLHPPMTGAEMRAVAERLGVPLPEEIRELMAVAGGFEHHRGEPVMSFRLGGREDDSWFQRTGTGWPTASWTLSTDHQRGFHVVAVDPDAGTWGPVLFSDNLEVYQVQAESLGDHIDQYAAAARQDVATEQELAQDGEAYDPDIDGWMSLPQTSIPARVWPAPDVRQSADAEVASLAAGLDGSWLWLIVDLRDELRTFSVKAPARDEQTPTRGRWDGRLFAMRMTDASVALQVATEWATDAGAESAAAPATVPEVFPGNDRFRHHDEQLAATRMSTELRLVETFYATARDSLDTLYTLHDAALRLAGNAVLASRPELVRRGFLLCGRSVAGLFACSASATDQAAGPVSFPMEGTDTFELQVREPSGWATPEVWLNGFHAAVAVRDTVSVDRLVRASSNGFGPVVEAGAARYPRTYVECLRSIWTQDGRAGALLDDVLRAADPARLQRDKALLAANVVIPAVEVLLALHLGEQDRFSRALAAAVEKHRVYWSQPSLRPWRQGVVALPLVAAAVLATRAGLAVEISTPYLPEDLLRTPPG